MNYHEDYYDSYEVTGVIGGKRIKRKRFVSHAAAKCFLLFCLDSGTLWGVVDGISYAGDGSAREIMERVKV